MHGAGTLILKNGLDFTGSWIDDKCQQYDLQVLEAKAQWQQEKDRLLDEKKKGLEHTSERMLEDELVYKFEH